MREKLLTSAKSLAQRLRKAINQTVCGMFGHDYLKTCESGRVFVRCSACQHETEGMAISGPGPRLRYEGDTDRHILRRQA